MQCFIIESVDSISGDGPDTPIYAMQHKNLNISACVLLWYVWEGIKCCGRFNTHLINSSFCTNHRSLRRYCFYYFSAAKRFILRGHGVKLRTESSC